MPRLPQPGGDSGDWGTILNEFLSVAHNDDGSLQPIDGDTIANNAVTAGKLSAGSPSSGQVLSYDNGSLNWSTVTSSGTVPDATDSTKGLVQLAGDIAGTAANPVVSGLQARPVAATAPSGGQVLAYNSSSSAWEPRTPIDTPDGWYSVKDYGAAGDGVTDDAPAIQALIDALNPLNNGGGGGIAGAVIYFPPGEYRINDTLDFHRFAGVVMGSGTGNSPLYTVSAGHAAVIKWGGTAGLAMIKVSDSRNISFKQLRFQGNNSALPLAGIEFYAPSPTDPLPHDSNGTGTNEYMVVEDCYFGVYTWTADGSSQGAMTNGILVQDPDENGNNDQFFFSRNQFIGRQTGQAATAGIKITSTQSIWGSIQNCFFNRLGVGVDTVASVTMLNGQYNACIQDVVARSTAQVHALGHWSENSGQIAHIASGGGTYHVRGGKWQLMSGGWTLNQENGLGGRWVEALNLGLGGKLIIDSVQIIIVGAYTEAWVAYIRSGNGVGNSPGRFRMTQCVGIGDTINSTQGDSTMVANLDRFNMAAAASSAGLQVDIDNPMLRYKRHLVSGGGSDLTQQMQHPNVNTGFFGAAPVARPTLTYSRSTEHASTAAIRQALATLGLITDNTTP